MRELKLQLNIYSPRDYLRIQEHLTHMAEKGWMLEQVDGFFWRYRICEPKKLRFCVLFFQNMDWEEPYRERCESAGWRFVSGYAGMQVFCTDDPNLAPLEIDPAKTNNLVWHGDVYGFRFDPVWGVGDFELESIEFHAAPPHKVLTVNGEIVDMAHDVYEEDGKIYIPFDTKSKLKHIPNMYYEWDKNSESLTIFGNKTAVFVRDTDLVAIDGNDIKLAKPLTFIDGIPHIEANILCDILDMEIKFGEVEVELNSKKG